MERNLLLKIAYDGSCYHGWQIQENAHTVQAEFQNALGKILGKAPEIKACSRTDTGVHARVFCISAVVENPITPERLRGALNHFLPESISCLSCEEVPMSFHARYSCKGKEYVYLIHNSEIRDPFLRGRALQYWYPMDEALLNEAAGHFVGAHDFTSFCTLDARKSGDLVRTVYAAGVERQGDKVLFTVSANGFLYNMVRIMVGTLLRVQQGKLTPGDIPEILRRRDRKFAGPTAPACGLYLNRVFYGPLGQEEPREAAGESPRERDGGEDGKKQAL